MDVSSQALLGISMAGHKPSFRSSGGLCISEKQTNKQTNTTLNLRKQYKSTTICLSYQIGKVHAVLAVLPVVFTVVFVAHLGFDQCEVAVRTTLHA